MYHHPSTRRVLDLIGLLADERDTPAVAAAFLASIELALDAALDIGDIAEAAGIGVDEIAEIDEARVVAHDDIVLRGLAEKGKRVHLDRLALGWRLRLACERGMSIATAAAAAGVTVDEAAVLIEQSPFQRSGPDDPPAD